MEDLSEAHLGPLPKDSPYVKPFRFYYTQNGQQKSWDLLKIHDSVAVIIFNVTKKALLFVKQFRPAVYYNSLKEADREGATQIDTTAYPASLGITIELCAGIVDKNKPLDVIAQEEVLEEVGYNVETKNLEKVLTYRSGVGVQGALQTLYYCEVTDDMKKTDGGGVDDEIIEVIEKSIPEIEAMFRPDNNKIVESPPSCLFGLMWFLQNKAHKYRK